MEDVNAFGFSKQEEKEITEAEKEEEFLNDLQRQKSPVSFLRRTSD